MAKSKSKKEEESIFDALALLEKEMNIPSDYMIEKISNAIRIALKKSNNGNDDIDIRIEPDKKVFAVFIRKTVFPVKRFHVGQLCAAIAFFFISSYVFLASMATSFQSN